ncbi:MAG: glycine cleavage system protein GcvH [Phycisphaeraceae bacterium]|nr:glycine cleavage system protein GcvH [Phycisphaeraceae bacterium]
MSTPSDCRFTESHEWVRTDGDIVTLGITRFAADELTDVTYVELRPAGTTVGAGDPIGEVESVKTTSDVYAPVSGTVVEINDAVVRDPSLVNSDPYGAGWLVRLRTGSTAPLEGLMDRSAYDARYGGS